MFGTFFFFWKTYRFGLFSKGFYCLLFNVLFMSLYEERFALYYIFLNLSTLFDNFFKKFFLPANFIWNFGQNKKLVTTVYYIPCVWFLLLILLVYFSFARYFLIIPCLFFKVNSFFESFYGNYFYILIIYKKNTFITSITIVIVNYFIIFNKSYINIYFLNFY